MIKCLNTFVFFYELFYWICMWMCISLDSTHTSTRTLTSAGRSLNTSSRAEQHAFIISSSKVWAFSPPTRSEIAHIWEIWGALLLLCSVCLTLAQHQTQSCGLIPKKHQQNRAAGCLEEGILVLRRVKCVIKRYILQYTVNTTNETTRDALMYLSITDI